MNSSAPREPSADMLGAANAMHEMFVALVKAGFTEDQALTVVAKMAGQASQSAQAPQ